MVNPHAVLIKRENFDEIIHETRMSYANLLSILDDSEKEGTDYYMVFRRNEDGFPTPIAMTAEQLLVEYKDAFLKDRFLKRFERI